MCEMTIKIGIKLCACGLMHDVDMVLSLQGWMLQAWHDRSMKSRGSTWLDMDIGMEITMIELWERT